MALKNCKECGNQVSTKAAACPHCGAAIQRKTHGCVLVLAGILLTPFIFGIIAAILNPTPSSGPSVQPSSHQRRESSENSQNSQNSQNSENESEEEAPTPKVYAEGETVHVGYTSYAVWRSWWSNRLSDNSFINQPPNAAYLFVELSVRNNDKQARMVPPLTLVDQNGAEFESSSNTIFLENAIGLMESLNPEVGAQGVVVFDVPPDRNYVLKLSGGYWSTEDAFVRLTPKAN